MDRAPDLVSKASAAPSAASVVGKLGSNVQLDVVREPLDLVEVEKAVDAVVDAEAGLVAGKLAAAVELLDVVVELVAEVEHAGAAADVPAAVFAGLEVVAIFAAVVVDVAAAEELVERPAVADVVLVVLAMAPVGKERFAMVALVAADAGGLEATMAA